MAIHLWAFCILIAIVCSRAVKEGDQPATEGDKTGEYVKETIRKAKINDDFQTAFNVIVVAVLFVTSLTTPPFVLYQLGYLDKDDTLTYKFINILFLAVAFVVGSVIAPVVLWLFLKRAPFNLTTSYSE